MKNTIKYLIISALVLTSSTFAAKISFTFTKGSLHEKVLNGEVIPFDSLTPENLNGVAILIRTEVTERLAEYDENDNLIQEAENVEITVTRQQAYLVDVVRSTILLHDNDAGFEAGPSIQELRRAAYESLKNMIRYRVEVLGENIANIFFEIDTILERLNDLNQEDMTLSDFITFLHTLGLRLDSEVPNRYVNVTGIFRNYLSWWNDLSVNIRAVMERLEREEALRAQQSQPVELPDRANGVLIEIVPLAQEDARQLLGYEQPQVSQIASFFEIFSANLDNN